MWPPVPRQTSAPVPALDVGPARAGDLGHLPLSIGGTAWSLPQRAHHARGMAALLHAPAPALSASPCHRLAMVTCRPGRYLRCERRSGARPRPARRSRRRPPPRQVRRRGLRSLPAQMTPRCVARPTPRAGWSYPARRSRHGVLESVCRRFPSAPAGLADSEAESPDDAVVRLPDSTLAFRVRAAESRSVRRDLRALPGHLHAGRPAPPHERQPPCGARTASLRCSAPQIGWDFQRPSSDSARGRRLHSSCRSRVLLRGHDQRRSRAKPGWGTSGSACRSATRVPAVKHVASSREPARCGAPGRLPSAIEISPPRARGPVHLLAIGWNSWKCAIDEVISTARRPRQRGLEATEPPPT